MKKNSIFALAAVAAMLSFTSCSNESELVGNESLATIELNITNDNALATRAVQNATVADWFAKVGDQAWVAAGSLQGKTYNPGTYTIQVANYQTEADAYSANEGRGAAFYTLTRNDVELVKGTNIVSFECGTAKNSMLSVDWSGTDGVTGLVMTNVAAVQSAKSRNYTFTANGDAYFYAGTDIVCTINYTYNGTPKTIEKTITAPAAATKYALNIGATSNGTITTLTITFDDEMNNGDPTSATIDAATGNEQ